MWLDEPKPVCQNVLGFSILVHSVNIFEAYYVLGTELSTIILQ